jgi:dipeptidyl aminopeptidase/acylaminoacyl peptidase
VQLTKRKKEKDYFSPDSPESLWLGGPIKELPDLVKRANPITYIESNDPPILIIHGEKDQSVIINQSELLYQALKKYGLKTDFIRVENAGHGYPPIPEDAIVRPSREEITKLEMAWFKEILGE